MEEEKNELHPDPEVAENEEKEKDDPSEWIGGCIVIVIAVALIWALVHFNPSETEHKECIAEAVQEKILDASESTGMAFVLSLGSVMALKSLEYHNLWLFSWTTVKQGGSSKISSIGILGWTHAFI